MGTNSRLSAGVHDALSGNVGLAPVAVDVLHLSDARRDVALLNDHPAMQRDRTIVRMNHDIVPDVIGKRAQQQVGRISEKRDDFERFARALVKVDKRSIPAPTVELDHGAARIGDELSRAQVQTRF